MTATGMIRRAGWRGRWRAWLALALLPGVFAGAVTAVAAGARRGGGQDQPGAGAARLVALAGGRGPGQTPMTSKVAA